jgi:uncharacterized protein YcgI (DUF1989 family)
MTAKGAAAREVVVKGYYGGAIEARAGELVTVTDLEGRQVGDFVAFNLDDMTQHTDMVRTRSTLYRLDLRVGDCLYSNRREPMLELVEDTVAVHDMLFPPCDPKRYAITWNQPGHRNCLTNLAEALAPYGVGIWRVPQPLNLFQNTPVLPDGRLGSSEPRSRAGDHVAFRALKNVVVALSACPMDLTAINGGKITDLKLSVRPG